MTISILILLLFFLNGWEFTTVVWNIAIGNLPVGDVQYSQYASGAIAKQCNSPENYVNQLIELMANRMLSVEISVGTATAYYVMRPINIDTTREHMKLFAK